MGGECPNPDCKEKVAGHGRTLYGDDGMGGAVSEIKDQRACLQKKVSRKGMILTTISIIAVLLSSGTAFTVYGLEALKEDREVATENKKDIATINAKLGYIEVMVEENHNTLEEIQDKIDEKLIDPKALEKLIKDAIKEGTRGP